MQWLNQTLRVTGGLLGQARYRRIVIAVSIVFLLIFLFSLQDLTFSGGPFSLTVVELSAMFHRTGFLLFDAVAVLRTPLFTWLVSPINTAIGIVISFLIGLNLTLSWIAWRQPKTCSVNSTTGAVGVLPALLAGGACCAPAILLVLGIQATATLMTAIQWMLPLALFLLLGSLAWIAQKTRTGMLSADNS